MNPAIRKEFDETAADLLNTVSGFSEEDFNKVPFEGSWTAAQTAEHILKSSAGVPETMMGNTTASSRESDEKESQIRAIFLDFDTKMQSPEFILPSEGVIGKSGLISKLGEVFERIKNILTGEDLTLVCNDFPFPGLGEFTRYEWICFVICHTKRHIHQMKNISRALSST